MPMDALFSIQLALLFTHEMDAVRRREWQLFPLLKNLKEETAYRFFTLAHIPFYGAVFFCLLSPRGPWVFAAMDIFLIFHSFLHMLFHRHPSNKLRGKMSLIIIHLAGILAAVHLMGLYL